MTWYNLTSLQYIYCYLGMTLFYQFLYYLVIEVDTYANNLLTGFPCFSIDELNKLLFLSFQTCVL
jgi:hypothetical protein